MELKLWPPPQEICHHHEIAPFTWNEASNIIIWQAPHPPPDGANDLAAQAGLKLQYKPDNHCHFSHGSQPASRAPRLPYLGSQGYFLNIVTDQIQGQANSETGLFYAGVNGIKTKCSPLEKDVVSYSRIITYSPRIAFDFLP